MVVASSRAPAHLPPPRPGQRVCMTYREWLAWAPDGWRSEWKDGEAVVFMPATELHQRIVGLLHVLFDLFVQARGLGMTRLGSLEVKLWRGGPAREPDVLVVGQDQRAQLGEERFSGGPTLVVEVISKGSVRRDRQEKREEYERAGVAEYWLIEPREGPRLRRSVTVYRLDAHGHYGPGDVVEAGVVRSMVLPGFWVRAEWLWTTPLPQPLELLEGMLRYPDGPEGQPAPEGLRVLPWASTLLQEGEARGRAQGEAWGRAEAVLQVLRERFGPVPAEVAAQVQGSADPTALDALLVHALRMSRLDDLFSS